MPRLGYECLYLSRDEVAEVGPSMAETIDAVTRAFAEKGQGLTQMPPKSAIHPLDRDTFIHAMPAFVPSAGVAGIKWVSGYPGNPGRMALPYITGLLMLNDPKTGVPIAVMDCTWVTAQRTGAVSGLAARLLARTDSSVVAILGTGAQARTQLAALAEALPRLAEVRLYDVNPPAVERFASAMQPAFPSVRLVEVPSAREAVIDADVVVTAGPILERPNPAVQVGWLKEGVLGLPIDFDSMWSAGALAVDKYYVDDLAQYRHYQEEGFFAAAPAALGDLGDLLSKRVPGRTTPSERIVSMNLGSAICDVVTAVLVYDRALGRGVGTILRL